MKKAKLVLSLVFMACMCLLFSALLGVQQLLVVAAVMFAGCVIVSLTMTTPAMALTVCGSISACLAPNCDYPIIGGLEVELYLANKTDVNDTTNSTITYGSNQLLISNWAMTTPKFFTYEGIKNSNNQKQTLIKGKINTRFDHELQMTIFNVDNAAKVQLEAMANGLVVAIIKNNYKGNLGKSKYEVLGLSQGLELASLEREANNADTQGAYNIVLKTPSGLSEAHLPANIWATDEATTDGIVAALLASCV